MKKQALRSLTAFLMRKIAGTNPPGALALLTITLTDNAGITDANTRVFNRAATTDVISLFYTPIPGAPLPEAEIILNAQRAADPTVRPRSWTVSDELALYLAHGIDHLTGADDHTPQLRQSMRKRELRWLKQARALHLLHPICPTPPASNQAPTTPHPASSKPHSRNQS